MKNLGFAALTATALTATALTAGFLGLAPPHSPPPTGAGNAQDTISNLQDQGYKVIVNRQSDRPLAEASVVSIGQGATFSHTNTNNGNQGGYGPNSDKQFAPENTMTVYVNVK